MSPLPLSFRRLAAVAGLVHGVTERAGGVSRGPWASWNLGRGSGDDPAAVDENARRLRAALGAPSSLRFPRQVHGAAILSADGDPAAALADGDGVVVSSPGLAVGVLGADCPGVLLVDPVRHALAVVHSGWRGTALGVVPTAVEALHARFATRPGDLLAGIGPGISAAAYEVGPEVADAVRAAVPGSDSCLARGRGDRWHLDLAAAIRAQLLVAGVAAAAIETMPLCTFSSPARFFSHRRDGARTGRHAMVAMWT